MRGLAATALLAGGAGTGLATVALPLHEQWWGLLLGVVATALTLVALPAGRWSRWRSPWAGPASWGSPRPRGRRVC